MTERPRYLRATLMAPLAVIPVIIVQMLISLYFESNIDWSSSRNMDDLLWALMIFLIYLAYVLAIAYVMTILFGRLSYWGLQKIGKATVGYFALVGGVLGLFVGGAFILVPIIAATTTACGASVAAAFGKIAAGSTPKP